MTFPVSADGCSHFIYFYWRYNLLFLYAHKVEISFVQAFKLAGPLSHIASLSVL